MRTVFLAFLLVSLAACSRRSFDDYLTSGRKYLESKKYAEAAIELENAARLDPQSSAAQIGLGETYTALDQPGNAASAYEQACRLDERNAAVCLEAASLLLGLDQFDGAIQAARAVLAVDKFSLDAQLLLASALTRTRRFADAEERIAAVLAMAPQDPRAYQALADVQRQRGRYKEAEALLRRAVNLDPAQTAARVSLAQLLFENGRGNEGEREIKAVLAVDPGDVDANRAYANYLVGTDQCDNSEAFFKEAAARSNEVSDWLALADFYVWSKRPDDAMKVLSEVSARDSSGEARARLASIMYDRGDRAGAESMVDGLVQRDPSNVSGLLLQARIALDAGDTSRARDLAHRAAVIAPSSPAVRDMLAALADAPEQK
jgi:Tfp pilus assembly protein PilF